MHHKMGCSRQALRYIASQQSELARAQFLAEISVQCSLEKIWVQLPRDYTNEITGC